MQRIDAHFHLWHFNEEEYDWLQGSLAPLRRNFLVPELLQELESAEVNGAVVVQARQSVAETEWLLDIAEATPAILGVVGWLPLQAPNIASVLASFREHSKLKAVRHVVQGEAAGFMDDPAFNRGVAAVTETGLAYDILIFAHQLEETIRLVDRHPHQSFVLDHIGKPRIAAGDIDSWAVGLRELAQRDNVVCKVSGMVTEADPHRWTPAQLQPYFDTVLEAFTPNRLLIGTDWPVLTAGCTYAQWWHTVNHWSAALSDTERAAIFGETARRTYRLQPHIDIVTATENNA